MIGLRGCHAEWTNKDDDNNITTNIYWVLTMCRAPWEHFPRIISFHPHINHMKKALVLPSCYKEGKWLLRDKSLIKDNKWMNQDLSPIILSRLLYITLTIAAMYNTNNNSYTCTYIVWVLDWILSFPGRWAWAPREEQDKQFQKSKSDCQPCQQSSLNQSHNSQP